MELIIIDESPLQPGQKLAKGAIHALLGGSDQHAMTSCLEGGAFLVFHDPVTSQKNKYDLWEGEQADGTFSYTGQGLVGSQTLTRSNKGLVLAGEKGLPIYFFVRPALGVKREKGNPYTYVGQVALENPFFEVKNAPDIKGNIREVFVFRLIPLGGAYPSKEKLDSEPRGVDCVFGDWAELQDSAIEGGAPKTMTQVELLDNKLQNRFGKWMISLGELPERVSIKVIGTKGALYPDFILSNRGLVVETIPTTSREHVRLAIGQVLDYCHLLAMSSKKLSPAILLPSLPQSDLVSLVKSLDISLIIEQEDGSFEFLG